MKIKIHSSELSCLRQQVASVENFFCGMEHYGDLHVFRIGLWVALTWRGGEGKLCIASCRLMFIFHINRTKVVYLCIYNLWDSKKIVSLPNWYFIQNPSNHTFLIFILRKQETEGHRKIWIIKYPLKVLSQGRGSLQVRSSEKTKAIAVGREKKCRLQMWQQ